MRRRCGRRFNAVRQATLWAFLVGCTLAPVPLLGEKGPPPLLSVELVSRSSPAFQEKTQVIEFAFAVRNLDRRSHVVKVSVSSEHLRAFSPVVAQSELEIGPRASAVFVVSLTAREEASLPALYSESVPVTFEVEGEARRGVRQTVAASAPLPEVGRPSVMVTLAQIDAAKRKVEDSDWARQRYEVLIEAAKTLLARPIVIPARGQPEHNDLALNARDLGVAFALTGDQAYARKAAEILVAYATQYRKYPPRDRFGFPWGDVAGVSTQPLDEARWAIPLAQAYDLIAESGGFEGDQRQRVERDLLRAAARVLQRPPESVSSTMCWRAAAMGLIGFALRDPDLVQRAVNGEYGVRRQMMEGVGDDGVWFEGSWGYHLLALEPLTAVAETSSHFGVDLFSAKLRKMLLAPILAMEPNRGFPAMNDTPFDRVEGRWYYEVARAHYGDEPLFTWLLSLSPRRGIEHVLYGDPETPLTSLAALSTTVFKDAGLAVLRSRDGEPIYVAMDYGTHGGWHGHYDKLGMVLYAEGREICIDPGSVPETSPAQEKWYRQTVSHNTLLVDQKSQAPGQGLLDFVHSTPSFQLAAFSCDTAYRGIMLDRCVGILGNRCVLVMDRVLGTQEHTYDWVLHARGNLRASGAAIPLTSPLGGSNGYDMLTDLAKVTFQGPFRGQFLLDDQVGLSLTMPLPPDAEVFAGKGMGPASMEAVPLVIARQKGYGAGFVALLDPWRGASKIERFSAGPVQVSDKREAGGYDIWISIEGRGWTIQGILSYNEDTKRGPNGIETDGLIGVVLAEEGRSPVGALVGGERLTWNGAGVKIEPPEAVMQLR